MKVHYLSSSPNGALPLGPEDLSLPFRTRPDETHPSLTLGDYLNALRDFVLQQGTRPLCRILSDGLNVRTAPEDLREVRIRTEKHGALYHVACVDAGTDSRRIRLAASTALSSRARACLAREERLLVDLNQRFGLPFLPRPLLSGEVSCGSGTHSVPLFILLAEWFEDFHEWHLDTGKTGIPRVYLWDQTGGYRFATDSESHDLLCEIARILTLYYDTKAYRQVLSWHHAAGDFVVRSKTPLQVRLTTVREYQPLPGLTPENGIHPLVALTYFFLHLLLRMRLDRRQGVTDPLWAGPWAVRGAVEGFFQALKEMQGSGRGLAAGIPEIRALFQGFSAKELRRLHEAVLDFPPSEDAEERRWTADHLDEHVATVYRALQDI